MMHTLHAPYLVFIVKIITTVMHMICTPTEGVQFVEYSTGFNTNLKSYELLSVVTKSRISCGSICEMKVRFSILFSLHAVSLIYI
jgi:hypothetical protein